MKNQIYKDNKKRILNYKLENKKFILKSIFKNTNVSKIVLHNSGLKFTEFSNFSYETALVNRCVLTGRNKRFKNFLKFSRLAFLKYARNGFIYGLKKSAW